MKDKISGYRRMLGKTQAEMATMFGISTQAYSAKERGITQFKDTEKLLFKQQLLDLFPAITVDDIFFS